MVRRAAHPALALDRPSTAAATEEPARHLQAAAVVVVDLVAAATVVATVAMGPALALVVGVPMGVYAALKRGTFISQAFMTLSLLGVSLPPF